MRIDRKLNLVIPVERDEGTIYVHSTPIGRDVFERYFLVISKAFSGIYSHGLNGVAGPRVAAMMLKKIATDMGMWDGADGVANGLMNEIRRLSNVVQPVEGAGWTTIPFQDALDRNLLTEDEVSEVEGAIAFFIVASAMHRRAELEIVLLGGLVRLWSAEISSLNSTEFAKSLRTSTETDSSGAKATASSIPS